MGRIGNASKVFKRGLGPLGASPRTQSGAWPSPSVPRDQQWTRRAMLIRTVQAAAGVAAARGLPETLAWAGDSPVDRSVWDAHVHLTGVAGTVEQRVDRLLEGAGRVGIERLVVCMGTFLRGRSFAGGAAQAKRRSAARHRARAGPRVGHGLRQSETDASELGRDGPLRARRPDGLRQAVDRDGVQPAGAGPDRAPGRGVESSLAATRLRPHGGEPARRVELQRRGHPGGSAPGRFLYLRPHRERLGAQASARFAP